MSITNVNVSTDPYPTPSEIQAEIDSLLVELKTHPSSTILLAEIMYVMQEYGAGIVYTQSNSISEMNKYIGQIKDVWNSIDAANNSSTAGTGVNTAAYQAKLENIVTEIQSDPFFNTPQGSAMKTQILGTITNLQSLASNGNTIPNDLYYPFENINTNIFNHINGLSSTFCRLVANILNDVNTVKVQLPLPFTPEQINKVNTDTIALNNYLNTTDGENDLKQLTSNGYGNFGSDFANFTNLVNNDFTKYAPTLHDLWVQYNGSTGAQGDTTVMSQLMRQMGQLNQQFTGASQILSAEVGVSTKTYQSEQSLFNNFLKMLSNLMKVMIQGQKTQ